MYWFFTNVHGLSLVVVSKGYSLAVGRGPLVVVPPCVDRRLQGAWASVAAHTDSVIVGLVTPQHVESYWIMGWACVVCHGRWILTHCTTREVQQSHVFVVFQLLNLVRLFATPWAAAHQAPLSSTVSWSLLKFMSIELVMLANHLTSVTPFSFCLQSFPASRSFPISWLLASGGQSIGASVSTSVSPTNIQSWFPLGFTGLMSLQSKGLSEEKPKLEGVQSLYSLRRLHVNWPFQPCFRPRPPRSLSIADFLVVSRRFPGCFLPQGFILPIHSGMFLFLLQVCLNIIFSERPLTIPSNITRHIYVCVCVCVCVYMYILLQ